MFFFVTIEIIQANESIVLLLLSHKFRTMFHLHIGVLPLSKNFLTLHSFSADGSGANIFPKIGNDQILY